MEKCINCNGDGTIREYQCGACGGDGYVNASTNRLVLSNRWKSILLKPHNNMRTGIELIAEKRAKHKAKGWTSEHDQEHDKGELAIVAADIAIRHTDARLTYPRIMPDWRLLDWHTDTVERLAIAGSLIAAEIDRILASDKEL